MDVARGSSALDGAATAFENFRTVTVGAKDYRELSWSKVRYSGAPKNPIRMEYDSESWSYVYVPEKSSHQPILDLFRQSDGEPLTIKDVQEVLGETSQAGYQRLKRQLDQLVDEERMLRRIKPRGVGALAYRLVTGDDDDDRGGLSI
jgi:hypothetical protein